jgi:hypothetical protein
MQAYGLYDKELRRASVHEPALKAHSMADLRTSAEHFVTSHSSRDPMASSTDPRNTYHFMVLTRHFAILNGKKAIR